MGSVFPTFLAGEPLNWGNVTQSNPRVIFPSQIVSYKELLRPKGVNTFKTSQEKAEIWAKS